MVQLMNILRSRIVINGYTFINGSTFKMNPDGTANHKLEDVSLAWQGNQPVYIVENKNDTMDYKTALTSRDRNGFLCCLEILAGVEMKG